MRKYLTSEIIGYLLVAALVLYVIRTNIDMWAHEPQIYLDKNGNFQPVREIINNPINQGTR